MFLKYAYLAQVYFVHISHFKVNNKRSNTKNIFLEKMSAIVIFVMLFISACVRSFEISQDSKDIEFDLFLNLFENCTVNLYNHRGLAINNSKTPVIIHTGSIFRIQHKFTNQAQLPGHCITAIYIPPIFGYNDSEGYDDFDDFSR